MVVPSAVSWSVVVVGVRHGRAVASDSAVRRLCVVVGVGVVGQDRRRAVAVDAVGAGRRRRRCSWSLPTSVLRGQVAVAPLRLQLAASRVGLVDAQQRLAEPPPKSALVSWFMPRRRS